MKTKSISNPIARSIGESLTRTTPVSGGGSFEHLFDDATGITLGGRASIHDGIFDLNAGVGSSSTRFNTMTLEVGTTYDFTIEVNNVNFGTGVAVRPLGGATMRTIGFADSGKTVMFSAAPSVTGVMEWFDSSFGGMEVESVQISW